MVNGSCRAVMTDMRFGRGLDHWPVLSLSGTPTRLTKRYFGRGLGDATCAERGITRAL
jgi:hypothetical protein